MAATGEEGSEEIDVGVAEAEEGEGEENEGNDFVLTNYQSLPSLVKGRVANAIVNTGVPGISGEWIFYGLFPSSSMNICLDDLSANTSLIRS